MSNAMALSAVTATIQYWLNNIFNQPASPLGSVSVTAKAPDIAQANLGKENSDLIVNLFLHQVTPNAAWRNIALPSLGGDGASRLTNQPLALDLHYLLTAYGSQDTEAEALLGYAVLMLHETPTLSRDQIRTALNAVPAATNPYSGVLKNSGLADQIEMIKITPATLGREEMAWLWTALKADYRPTFPFQVSVVLIQPQQPTIFALPVMKNVVTVQAGLQPQIVEIAPPLNQAASGPGDTATVTGQTLNAVTKISLSNARLDIEYPPFAPVSVGNATLTFKVPNDPPNLPAGIYDVTALVIDGLGNVQTSSNALPMAVAPSILSMPAPAATNNAAGTLVTIHCAPQVRPGQEVSLILGSSSAPAISFSAQTDTLSFQFPTPPLAPGNYVGRLSVDGIVSAVQVNWAATPPAFVTTVVIP